MITIARMGFNFDSKQNLVCLYTTAFFGIPSGKPEINNCQAQFQYLNPGIIVNNEQLSAG